MIDLCISVVANLGSPDVLGLKLSEARIFGSFSPRTSGDPSLGTTYVHGWYQQVETSISAAVPYTISRASEGYNDS